MKFNSGQHLMAVLCRGALKWFVDGGMLYEEGAMT